MFSWYKYLIVSFVFSHLGFWSGSLFLIAHFPDLCLLVPFCVDYPVESCKISIILFGSMLPSLKGHLRDLNGRNRGMVHPLSHKCVRCSLYFTFIFYLYILSLYFIILKDLSFNFYLLLLQLVLFLVAALKSLPVHHP